MVEEPIPVRTIPWLLSIPLLVSCASSGGGSSEADAERAARCADLNRQIAELSKRPVRRSELQRRYDVECTSR